MLNPTRRSHKCRGRMSRQRCKGARLSKKMKQQGGRGAFYFQNHARYPPYHIPDNFPKQLRFVNTFDGGGMNNYLPTILRMYHC